MSSQSPLISIPKKTTTDVDWTNPIRSIVAHSYGEDPNAYAEECSVLQRCRQDAVRGAGSDQTARDLLYKYFGQLELLELRFAEIKVAFPWNDAFTTKLTTQTSLAFEKASIIHLLAAILSALASSNSRSDPEGLKRAYYNSRASAGMLTYINENFLHAPSTDLSREVIHLLIGTMMAQATEIFTEKLIDEKKSPGLVCRSANQAAAMYGGLVDEMKEFQGKGVFDRNWLYVLQIKAKLFASLAQYYRSVADGGAGKHGASLVRMKLAETMAQDAQRQASNFTYTFVSTATPSLPSDAATSLAEIIKAHATLCSEAKAQSTKDNDLIYHDILPSEAALPGIDKLPPAAPITIQEVYGNADVSKLIGPDIFIRLVPLAVHESASVYSEEKAKLVRLEVERVDISEGEVRAGLEHLTLPAVFATWRRLADDDEGDVDVEISREVRRLAEEIERGGPLDLRTLESERERCERELREMSGMLDNESRECERMRAKYAPQFTQSPSGPHTAHLRSTISSNLGSLSAAETSDSHLVSLLQSVQPDVTLLSSGMDSLHKTAREVAGGVQAPGVSLLDLQDETSSSGLGETEKEELGRAVSDAQERLDRLGKIRRERDEVLKDLKEKVQNDDVSSLLLLNRRSQNVEPQLFASELEKFRPYQGRLAAAVQASKSILQELEMAIRQVEKGKGVKERQRGQKDRQRRLREWERKLKQAGESYGEVQAGLSKGLSYYDSLGNVIDDLSNEVRGLVRTRESERNRMVSEIETRQRLTSPPPAARGLDARLDGLSLGGQGYPGSPPPQPAYSSMPPPPPQPSTSRYAPAPPPPRKPSPYDFGNLDDLPSAFSTAPPPSRQYPSGPLLRHTSPTAKPYPPPQSSRPSRQDYSYPSALTYPSATPSTFPTPPAASQQPPYSASQNPYPPPPPARTSSSSYSSPPSHQPYHAASPPPNQYSSYQPPPAAPQYHRPPPANARQYQPPPTNSQQYQLPPNAQQYHPPSTNAQQYNPPPSNAQQHHPPPQQYGGYQSPPPPQQYQQNFPPQTGYQYR